MWHKSNAQSLSFSWIKLNKSRRFMLYEMRLFNNRIDALQLAIT